MTIVQEYKQPGGAVNKVIWSQVLAFCFWNGWKDNKRVHLLRLDQVVPFMEKNFLLTSLTARKRQKQFVTPLVMKNHNDVTYTIFAKVEQGITVSGFTCGFLSGSTFGP